MQELLGDDDIHNQGIRAEAEARDLMREVDTAAMQVCSILGEHCERDSIWLALVLRRAAAILQARGRAEADRRRIRGGNRRKQTIPVGQMARENAHGDHPEPVRAPVSAVVIAARMDDRTLALAARCQRVVTHTEESE